MSAQQTRQSERFKTYHFANAVLSIGLSSALGLREGRKWISGKQNRSDS
jgi:hypothetical protein